MAFNLKVVALALFALVAVGHSMPVNKAADETDFNINTFIANVVSTIIVKITDEINNLVDFVLESLLSGGSSVTARSMQESAATKAFVNTRKKNMMLEIIKFVTEVAEELTQMVQNGIAITSQILDSFVQGLAMLLGGDITMAEYIIDMLVTTLGVLGRKRRDVDMPVLNAMPNLQQLFMEKANARLAVSPVYQQMTVEQRTTAVEVIQWGISQLLNAKNE